VEKWKDGIVEKWKDGMMEEIEFERSKGAGFTIRDFSILVIYNYIKLII